MVNDFWAAMHNLMINSLRVVFIRGAHKLVEGFCTERSQVEAIN